MSVAAGAIRASRGRAAASPQNPLELSPPAAAVLRTERDAATRSAVATTTTLTMLLRLFAAAVSVPAVFARPDPRPGLVALALSAGLAAATLGWRRQVLAGPARCAALFGVELALDTAVFLLDGVHQPFLCQSIGTAALAASLWGAAGVGVGAAVGLLSCALALWVPAAGTVGEPTLATVVGIPAPYVLTGLLFVVIRHVYRDQVLLRGALQRTSRAAARAEERSRLARELHDSLAKTLTGIALSAHGMRSATQSTEVAALAGDIAGAADRALVEARVVIADLRADGDDTDVGAAVHRTVTAWSRSAHEQVEVDLRPVPEPAAAARRELLSVLREALFNVGRHAGASRVRVELAAADGLLHLTVRDDGRGFVVPADLHELTRHGRYGLLGMAERLRSVGGRFAVESRPGAGTAVTGTVPVSHRGGQGA